MDRLDDVIVASEMKRRGLALALLVLGCLLSSCLPVVAGQFGFPELSEAPFPWPEVGYVSQGTGFVIGSDGYVLTNFHVVRDAEAITVSTGGRNYAAQVVGSVPEHDAALLKVDAWGLPVVSLGYSSEVEIGDVVYAVGCPAGVCGTVTGGHVANLGIGSTFDEGNALENLMMLDLTITHGSSGGPLVNEQGQVVGITMGGIEGSGFGFAVPTADLVTLLGSSGSFLQAAPDRLFSMTEIRAQLLPSVAYIEADRSNRLSLPSGYPSPSYGPFNRSLPTRAEWAEEDLQDTVVAVAEGDAPSQEWRGATVSYSVPNAFFPGKTLSCSAEPHYVKWQEVTVFEASSPSGAQAVVNEILATRPDRWWYAPALDAQRFPIEDVLRSEQELNGAHVIILLTLQCGGDVVGRTAAATYHVLGSVGNLAMWFAFREQVSFSDMGGCLQSLARSGGNVVLRSYVGEVASLLSLDDFRAVAAAEATRVFNFILGQL